jgi:hypothetical protein
MTRFDRAAQLWSLLVFAARNQKILSYTIVQKLTNIPRVGAGRCLAPIQDYCEEHGFPQLTSIVVRESEGDQGEGFHKNNAVEEPMFKAQARVFVFDWFKADAPKPEDLEKAYRKKHPEDNSRQE